MDSKRSNRRNIIQSVNYSGALFGVDSCSTQGRRAGIIVAMLDQADRRVGASLSSLEPSALRTIHTLKCLHKRSQENGVIWNNFSEVIYAWSRRLDWARIHWTIPGANISPGSRLGEPLK